MFKVTAFLLASLSIPLMLATKADAQDEITTAENAAPSVSTAESQKPFFLRLADAYQEDWHPTGPAGPDPLRRGFAAPLDSPPYPSSDYSVGGTSVIGAPDTQ